MTDFVSRLSTTASQLVTRWPLFFAFAATDMVAGMVISVVPILSMGGGIEMAALRGFVKAVDFETYENFKDWQMWDMKK